MSIVYCTVVGSGGKIVVGSGERRESGSKNARHGRLLTHSSSGPAESNVATVDHIPQAL